MIVDVKYGKDGVQKVEIPDQNYIGTFYPKDVECGDPDKVIGESIDNPIGYASMEEFLKGGEDIVFIVNDGTRPTPTAKVLDALSKRMDLRSARYLIATGTHRDMTPEEYDFVFGSHYQELKDRIICHDAKNSECVYLGDSKNGTPMEVNKVAVDADRLIIITSVEPHYFAGYTGGRKEVLPARGRILQDRGGQPQARHEHGGPVPRPRGQPRPRGHDGRARGREGQGDLLHPDGPGQAPEHLQGRLRRPEPRVREGCRLGQRANEVFSVPIPEKADVVISVAPYPMDVDLYQSQKALDNGKWALKEGGKIIMVSKCREGIGHATFLTQLSSSKDPKQVLENLKAEYKLGYHKAAKMAEIATWASIWAVTDLDPELLRNANITPFPTVADAVGTPAPG